ncbi:MAG: hypothetical protein A2029_09100 [Chloroflexi bacterium RBG_19FT_COMBO_47_9]|nr:MAG: hypothetical protein A2029_09100 [Chloroflexi bacterium RBG_19FT_COMBO_47_9]
MNHQPFRDWLLSEEKLSAEQIREMQEHVRSCESCRQTESAWTQVESAFRAIPQAQPAPGFTSRWQAHLAEYLAHKQKRRGWMMISLNVVITISLLILVITQLWSLVQAPGPYLVAWFTRLFSLVTIYLTLQDMFRSLPGSIPLLSFLGMFLLVGIISFMSVLWLATYRKLSFARRII